MAVVGPGELELFDPPEGAAPRALVSRFLLAKTAVTNRDFLQFVLEHPHWQRGRVPGLFADSHYLQNWADPTELGEHVNPTGPVVRVSWFSAKAYCEAQGARLPTEVEWEFAARADEHGPKPKNPERRQREILTWYAEPTPERIRSVGRSRPNFWGVKDLHGLIWEWVYDFNSRVAGDGRRTDEAFVCGGTSLRGSDKSDYATFMRAALRASLKGSYTTASLGFRCAADYPEKSEASQ